MNCYELLEALLAKAGITTPIPEALKDLDLDDSASEAITKLFSKAEIDNDPALQKEVRTKMYSTFESAFGKVATKLKALGFEPDEITAYTKAGRLEERLERVSELLSTAVERTKAQALRVKDSEADQHRRTYEDNIAQLSAKVNQYEAVVADYEAKLTNLTRRMHVERAMSKLPLSQSLPPIVKNSIVDLFMSDLLNKGLQLELDETGASLKTKDGLGVMNKDRSGTLSLDDYVKSFAAENELLAKPEPQTLKPTTLEAKVNGAVDPALDFGFLKAIKPQ